MSVLCDPSHADNPDLTWSWKYEFVSPRMRQMLPAFTAAESEQVHWRYHQIPTEDRVWIRHTLERAMLSERVQMELEYRVIDDSGGFRWFQDRIEMIRRKDGIPESLVGITAEITQAKREQLEIRERENRLRRVFETNPNGILLLDPRGAITDCNTEAESILGQPREQLLGLNWNQLALRDRVTDSQSPQLLAVLEDSHPTQYGYEAQLIRPDGRIVDIAWNVATILGDRGEVTEVILTFQDWSNRYRADEALRASQERLRRIFESVADVVMIVDRDWRVSLANPAAEQLFGIPRVQLTQQNWRDLPWAPSAEHPAGGPMEMIARQVIGLGKTVTRVELALLRGNHRLTLSASFVPLHREQELIGMVVSATDITERVEAARIRQRSEERFRALVQGNSDGIWLCDADGLIQYASESTELLVGLPGFAQLGRRWSETVPLEKPAEWFELWGTLRTQPGIQQTIHVNLSRGIDDFRIWEVSIRNRLREPIVAAIVVHARDVTAERRLQEQLKQAQKMEAIGELASGLAHDFGNLLTVIQGELGELILDDVPTAWHRSITAAKIATELGTTLTKILLGLARRVPICVEPVVINPRIREVVFLLERVLRKTIRFELDLDENLGIIEADGMQIAQVVLNLCLNARDAMPKGGTIRIQTRNESIPTDGIPSREAPRDWVKVVVEDTGTGMSEATRAKIFEPFFTTKPSGKGTGLGLAIVSGIVKQHQGEIRCTSQEGVGTRFEIVLPRIRSEESE
ncbi:PAS domain S-box protein [Tuwongella immobilis]|nr:PAS domain S-box protein [Tuwongella immobilis]